MTMYCEAVLTVVVALCVIIKAEHTVVKPVVPKFCIRLCNETTRCNAFAYKASDLSCHLYQESLPDSKMVHTDIKLTCPNDIADNNRESLQRSRPSGTVKKGDNKRAKKKTDGCRRKHCKPPDKLKTLHGRSWHRIYRKENITCNQEYDSTIVTLPMIAKPGMKIVSHGEYMEGLKDSQFSLSRDDYHKKTTKPWLWFHIFMKWKLREIHVTEGFHNFQFEGDFPINDPSHFTLAIELTPISTKIYAGNVLVHTVKPFSAIADVYFRRFKKVHSLEVQKTG